MDPDRWHWFKMKERGSQCVNVVLRHNNTFGRHSVDAVGKRWTCEIGIEQRYNYSDARDAKPYRHILRPIAHHQTDDVAFFEALVECPPRILVGSFGEIFVGKTFLIGKKSRGAA